MALDDAQEAALRDELRATKDEQARTAQALKDANKEGQGHRLSADRANEAANTAKAALDDARAKATTDADTLRADLTAKATAADERAAKAKVDADYRTIQAELRAAAVMAGMRKPDLVKLLDTSAVTLGEDGKVVIPASLFEDAKKADPYLFGTTPPSTGSTAPVPDPSGGKAPLKYDDMTPDQQREWKRLSGIR